MESVHRGQSSDPSDKWAGTIAYPAKRPSNHMWHQARPHPGTRFGGWPHTPDEAHRHPKDPLPTKREGPAATQDLLLGLTQRTGLEVLK